MTTADVYGARSDVSAPPNVRLNVGCGPHPTPGWINYDNSFSVRMAQRPHLVQTLIRLGVLGDAHAQVAMTAMTEGVRWGSALALGHADNSVQVLYSSHMLEHLDRKAARLFLAEAYRVLAPGGTLRVAVPDLRHLVDRYVAGGDADEFIANSLLTVESPRTIAAKLRYLLVGSRHHVWMYDARSLVKLIESAGFCEVESIPAGCTRVTAPGQLDLRERQIDSVYVEASKPAQPSD